MLPSITPPTDSLYKFLTLVGLTVFLFYIIMLSDTYRNSTSIQINVENLAYKMREETGVNLKRWRAEDHKVSLRPFKNLEAQLKQLNRTLSSKKIIAAKKYRFEREMNAYQIQIDANQTKIMFCWTFVFIGILIIIIGFVRWSTREQNLRNTLLELEIKEKELTIEKLKNELPNVQ